jgi:hypothetical protein
LWSIKHPSDFAYNLILSVVMEEMLHMALALNMLVAVGGTPAIVAPTYPGPLPGGVRPELEVYLGGLTKESVAMFMQIELPEEPVALLELETFPTIGAFYDAIAEAFRTLSPPLSQDKQIKTRIGVPNPAGPDQPRLREDVIVIGAVADAEAAIATIKNQGEGVSGSPEAPDHELAHYYRFAEIYYEHKLIKVGDKWQYSGDPVSFPDVWPVARVPAGGYPAVTTEFDEEFGTMISWLEKAWTGGGVGDLSNAIGSMLDLGGIADTLVKKELPDGSGGHYGPDFIPIAPDSGTP